MTGLSPWGRHGRQQGVLPRAFGRPAWGMARLPLSLPAWGLARPPCVQHVRGAWPPCCNPRAGPAGRLSKTAERRGPGPSLPLQPGRRRRRPCLAQAAPALPRPQVHRLQLPRCALPCRRCQRRHCQCRRCQRMQMPAGLPLPGGDRSAAASAAGCRHQARSWQPWAAGLQASPLPSAAVGCLPTGPSVRCLPRRAGPPRRRSPCRASAVAAGGLVSKNLAHAMASFTTAGGAGERSCWRRAWVQRRGAAGI